jgi:hypothetical protein
MVLERHNLKRTEKIQNPFEGGEEKEKVTHIQGTLLMNWVINEEYVNSNTDFIVSDKKSLESS